jgi:hypothetical protein
VVEPATGDHAAVLFPPKEEILDRVEVVAQREILIHGLNAKGRCVAWSIDSDSLASEQVFPRLWMLDP